MCAVTAAISTSTSLLIEIDDVDHSGVCASTSFLDLQPRLTAIKLITVILCWCRCSATRLLIGKLIPHKTTRLVAESHALIVPIGPEVSRVIAFTRTLFFFDLLKVFFRAILSAESVVSENIALPSIRLHFASRQLEALATCCRALYHALEGLVATGVGEP